DGKGKLPEGSAIIIWTTTPWTLPANLGICVHPDYEYALVEVDHKPYLLAMELLEQAAHQMGWENYQQTATYRGAELEFIKCQHPCYDRESVVMLGENVTLEAGTGCVQTAPGHGEDDFIVAQKYAIGVLCPIDDQGKFTDGAPGFEGIFYD